MNALEREQLSRFLQDLASARATSKDAEAERLIQETCARQPDSGYLLTQRCLLLDQAMKGAQAEISRLQTDLENTRGGGNFLNANAWGSSAAPRPAPQPMPNVAPLPQPAAAIPASNSSFGGAGILGSIATTAAGVVAGSFLFQGIEHLMGHHGSGSGFLGGQNTPLMTDTSSQNVVTDNSSYVDDSSDMDSDFDSLLPSDSDLDSV